MSELSLSPMPIYPSLVIGDFGELCSDESSLMN